MEVANIRLRNIEYRTRNFEFEGSIRSCFCLSPQHSKFLVRYSTLFLTHAPQGFRDGADNVRFGNGLFLSPRQGSSLSKPFGRTRRAGDEGHPEAPAFGELQLLPTFLASGKNVGANPCRAQGAR